MVLHGKTETSQLRELADELGVRNVTCDVADAQAAQCAVREVLSFEPQIHALINCAGHVNPKPFLERTDADRYPA